MNELTTIYHDILIAVGCTISPDGDVLYKDKPVEVAVNGVVKVLRLPTQMVLKEANWDETVAFHLGCESIFAGQSEVLNAFITIGSQTIYETVMLLATSIAGLATDKASFGKLSLAQTELLRQFEEFDQTTMKLMLEVAKRNTGISKKYPIVSFRLDRGGEIDGTIYSRTCSIIPHILNNENVLCGYNGGSNKAKKNVIALFKLLFPEERTYGSNSNDIPYLLSFLECYYHMAKHLNKIKHTLSKYAKTKEIPVKWYTEIDSIPRLVKRLLPQSMPGNSGVSLKDESGKEITGQTEEPVIDVKLAETEELSEAVAANNNLTSRGLMKLSSRPAQNVQQAAPVQPMPPVQQQVFQQPVMPPQVPVQSMPMQAPQYQQPPMYAPQYAAPAPQYQQAPQYAPQYPQQYPQQGYQYPQQQMQVPMPPQYPPYQQQPPMMQNQQAQSLAELLNNDTRNKMMAPPPLQGFPPAPAMVQSSSFQPAGQMYPPRGF